MNRYWLTLILTWNIIKAAIEEGVVVGGGCCLLRLSKKVDAIKELLDNEEQKVAFLSHILEMFDSELEDTCAFFLAEF